MVGLMFLMPSTHKHETKIIKGGKLLIVNCFDQSIACTMFFVNHTIMHKNVGPKSFYCLKPTQYLLFIQSLLCYVLMGTLLALIID
jgi:hypothetical protein